MRTVWQFMRSGGCGKLFHVKQQGREDSDFGYSTSLEVRHEQSDVYHGGARRARHHHVRHHHQPLDEPLVSQEALPQDDDRRRRGESRATAHRPYRRGQAGRRGEPTHRRGEPAHQRAAAEGHHARRRRAVPRVRRHGQRSQLCGRAARRGEQRRNPLEHLRP